MTRTLGIEETAVNAAVQFQSRQQRPAHPPQEVYGLGQNDAVVGVLALTLGA